MAQPITFLKYYYFSERILIDTQIFLKLNKLEFNCIISSIFLSQNIKNKNGIFSGEEILKTINILMGEKYKSLFYIKEIFKKLVEKEYFIFVTNKIGKFDQMPYYKINKEKINYFLSTLSTFIDYEIKPIRKTKIISEKSIKYSAKKDVLKHIKFIKMNIKKEYF